MLDTILAANNWPLSVSSQLQKHPPKRKQQSTFHACFL
uniref:Uncharacterized protein n=1 Tax=Arundo donax TaxID=35708 RepID=A0A0A9B6F5_ARUDO